MASVNLDVATNLGISCRKGDTFKLVLTITDASNNPIDVTQYTFKMLVKDGVTTVLTFEDVNFTKNSNGTLTASQTSEVMNAITPGTYRYDLESTRTSDDFVQTWIFGNFTVKADFS